MRSIFTFAFDKDYDFPTSPIQALEDGTRVVRHSPAISEIGAEAILERLNPFDVYTLSKELRAFAAFEGDTAPTAVLFDFWNAQRVVTNLLAGKPIPCSVSRSAIQQLNGILKDIESRYFSTAMPDGTRESRWPSKNDPLIPSWQFGRWRATLQIFETVFAAEMGDSTIYYVPQRGIYLTPALVERADDSFPAELRTYIPEKTKIDWRAAGRCLAFNLPTASGFHVVRAVEGTLEAYYQMFTSQPGKTEHGWSAYIEKLQKLDEKIALKPDAKTLAVLDQMRNDYRNPVAHPRTELSDADCRMLFNLGEGAIIGMAQELLNAGDAAQTVLALGSGSAPAVPKDKA